MRDQKVAVTQTRSGVTRVWASDLGYRSAMSPWDDDDWTGEPPEGRHSASRADPGFWRQNRAPLSITATGVGIALIILALVLLL
jgi:hypothetical protein